MFKDKITVNVNSNFHHLCGEDLFEKKQANFLEYRNKWKNWPKNFHTGEFPLFIDLEVTSICNLKCPFCATTSRGKKIDKGFISFDIVRRIIDEGARENLYGIKFNLRGEPLLHPDIHKFVKYAKQSGLIDVYFNTNSVLLDGDMAKRLIEAGLDRISISVEGYTKEVYERHRVGANFEKVLSNIERLQSLKSKLKVDYPKVRVQAVILPDAGLSVQEYKKFWIEKVDEVAFLDYKEMSDKRRGVQFHWACPQLWQRMSVWWDGTILPCNHDDDGLIALGNIKDTSIKQAWNSKRLNQIRELHKRGLAHEVLACDGCYLRDSEISKLIKNNKL